MASRKGQKSDDSTNTVVQQALKEAEIIAELAPNEKTRKEAEKLIETIEDNSNPNYQEAQREVLNDVLDETKKVIKKTTNEAKREIPRYTEALRELQEETVQTTKEIGYDCIEFQRELTSLLPYLQQTYMSYFMPWTSTRSMTEYYTKLVDNFVANTVAATNLANTLAVVNMESIRQTSDTNRENCRLGVNSLRRTKESLTQTS
jgi:hypothetical protein